MQQLRDYQEKAAKDVARKLAAGVSPVIFQLATGGGKTVTFATITKRYLEKSRKRVLILVHREELMLQTRRTLFDWYGINAPAITAQAKHLPPAEVYVGMCETVHRRVNRPGFLPEFGLIIIDECHLGNYPKIMEHYAGKLIIGFTATPVSAKVKEPLKNHFKDIVCGVDIPKLIEDGNLCQNITYRILGINRSQLAVSMGDFNDKEMSEELSKVKHVQNTIAGYEKYAMGKKTIIFNVNVLHSKIVCDAFIEAGYNARHLDATSEGPERKAALKWLKETPDAILCNVGILTTGFDEPSVECIVVNKATMSRSLWLQMTGRGSRPFAGKEYFTIIDMGDNIMAHGDWCEPVDWASEFHNPKKPSKDGIAPVKSCPKCEAMLSASANFCKFCGYVFPSKEEVYDGLPANFEAVISNQKVADIIEKYKDKNEWFPFFKLGNDIARLLKQNIPGKTLTKEQYEEAYALYLQRAKEWCSLKNKSFGKWHREVTAEKLTASLLTHFDPWQ